MKESDLPICSKTIFDTRNRKILIDNLDESYRYVIFRGMRMEFFSAEIKYRAIKGTLLYEMENSYNISKK